MTSRPLACIALFGLATAIGAAQDKKKQMIVQTDQSARQVNNHPYSYTSPGEANTNCSSSGTVNATGTTYGDTTNINGTTNTDTNCNTTYRPPQTTSGNIVTVDNASWVRDVATGDRYLIQCTSHWAGSKCSYLEVGQFKAVLDGNTIWITGMKGMKEMTAKYHVLRFIPASHPYSPLSSGSPATPAMTTTSTPTASATTTSTPTGLSQEEKFTWDWYTTLPKDDKDYVDSFCALDPTGRALLPRVKVNAGEPAERALYCQPWLAARSKQK